MARTPCEIRFAHILGRIGEDELAPLLLPKMGITKFRNLNHRRMNHPWADYVGHRDGRCVAIAVRTRINWEKPQAPGAPPKLKRFLGKAGQRKADAACRLIRKSEGLPETEPIDLLWIAILIDLDNTFEAYWGFRHEMREWRGGSEHLDIRVDPGSRAFYADEGRRLAWHEPCAISWEHFPEEWACPARARYETLHSIFDRDRRIEQAIRGVAVSPRRHARREVDSMRPPPLSAPSAPPHPAECQAAEYSDTAPSRPHDLEAPLRACRNPAQTSFFRARLSEGQPTTSIGLAYWLDGRSRWCLDIRPTHARVVQKGRFAGDEDLWHACLSPAAREGLHKKRSGRYLVFRLVTESDFAGFQSLMERHACLFQWLDWQTASDEWTAPADPAPLAVRKP